MITWGREWQKPLPFSFVDSNLFGCYISTIMEYFAHSGKSDIGISCQSYSNHVNNVVRIADGNVDYCLKNSSLSENEQLFFREVVLISALYHDLGKLDITIQTVLKSSDYSDEKILNHVDAGVALCVNLYESTGNLVYLMSAYFIKCHHLGMGDFCDSVCEKPSQFPIPYSTYSINHKIRDLRKIAEVYSTIKTSLERVKDYVDSNLNEYCKIHDELVNAITPTYSKKYIPLSPFSIRMAFSCFVNADHEDTGNHYKTQQDKFFDAKRNDLTLAPSDRIQLLDDHVNSLNDGKVETERSLIRKQLYASCSTCDTSNPFAVLDAIVGSGKTFSGLKYGLRVAKDYDCERLFTIQPFTNIIQQTVDVYRQSIQLPCEDSIAINEIHSKCEFENSFLRKYSNLWRAPINVSTTVQFFESLVRGNVGGIKKICNFANSVVIIDEYHNCMPHYFWDYILDVLNELAKFNVHFLFCSGSSVYYWNLFSKKMVVYDVLNQKVFNKFQLHERERVSCVIDSKNYEFESSGEFYRWSMKCIGNRNSALMVFNTIKNSVAVAEFFRAYCKGFNVYHLSSSLTPKDREIILKKVKSSLQSGGKTILIATSIVECGIDFSFDVGFREKCGVLSYLQFNGRINRNGLLKNSVSYMFDFSSDVKNNQGGAPFTINPQLIPATKVLDRAKIEHISPEYCSQFVEMELEERECKFDFANMERRKLYKLITDEFRIINSDVITIIIDREIGEKLKKGEFVSYQSIIANSVQKWSNFIEKIEKSDMIEYIEGHTYLWHGNYDADFIGIKTEVE